MEIGNTAGRAGGGAAVRNAILCIVLVSFAEITDDPSISWACNSKSCFLALLMCRLSSFAAAVSSYDSALGSAPCAFLLQGPQLSLTTCRSHTEGRNRSWRKLSIVDCPVRCGASDILGLPRLDCKTLGSFCLGSWNSAPLLPSEDAPAGGQL